MTALAQALADELRRLCPQMSGVDVVAERLATVAQVYMERLFFEVESAEGTRRAMAYESANDRMRHALRGEL